VRGLTGLLVVLTAAAPVLAKPFVHPGCLSTETDFERMRTKVQAGTHPWIDSWNLLIADGGARADYKDHVQKEVYRNSNGGNFQFLAWDAQAAYELSLRWQITGEKQYADAGVRVLMAWANTCKRIHGDPNAQLIALNGYQLACAAENLRKYAGWSRADFAKFRAWIHDGPDPTTGSDWWVGSPKGFLETHWRANPEHCWANWDLSNMACLMAISVLSDDRDLYNFVLKYWRSGAGNGAMSRVVYYMHPGYMGQWQEAGRDQGHAMLGPALLAVICEIAWNQGDDLYGERNNLLLAGTE